MLQVTIKLIFLRSQDKSHKEASSKQFDRGKGGEVEGVVMMLYALIYYHINGALGYDVNGIRWPP